MQRWLYAAVATAVIYLIVLQLPSLLANLTFGFGLAGKFNADDFAYHTRPLVLLGLASWVLFGREKQITRWSRLLGIAMMYPFFSILGHSIEYDYEPLVIIGSVVVVAFGLLLTIGDIDHGRLRGWAVWSLFAGAAGCCAIALLQWSAHPASFEYALYPSIPPLLLAVGILFKCRSLEPLSALLIRWLATYVIASFGVWILLDYKKAGGGFWYWLFEDSFTHAAVAAATLVFCIALLVSAAPPVRRHGLSSAPQS